MHFVLEVVVDFFVKSQVPIISVFMQIYLMPVGLDVPCKKKSDCFFVVFLRSGATFKKKHCSYKSDSTMV